MTAILGVINLINEKPFMKELTNHRCLASVPFAGRYRLIDFTLSNYIHANISNVAVFTKAKYRSIMDHLGSGKEWDLDRRNGGLSILPPVNPDKKIKGDIQQFYDYIEMFYHSSADTVVISPGYHIGKINYTDAITQHRMSGADITVLYKDYKGEAVEKPIYHKCYLQDDKRISNIELYTFPMNGEPVCLETYILSKNLFIDLVQQCVKNEEYDFLKDVVKANLQHLKIEGFHFTGEMPFIHSIESFHKSNMEFLNPQVVRAYFYENGEVFTKIKHEAPAKYSLSSHVSNSLIANGCDIEGTVENSIIFRGVKIKKGATVKNSIIMQKGEIEENVFLENVITDKQAKVTKDRVLIGSNYPIVIKKLEVL